MGSFAVGNVVLVPFPYADFSRVKKRPALVVGEAEFNNLILCQITSNAQTSKVAISLKDNDFQFGSLELDSFIRPDKLFTVEQAIIEQNLGSLKSKKLEEVKIGVRKLFV